MGVMRNLFLPAATALALLAGCAAPATLSLRPSTVEVSAKGIDLLTDYQLRHGRSFDSAVRRAFLACVGPRMGAGANLQVNTGENVASASGAIPFLLTLTVLDAGASMQNFSMAELRYQASFSFGLNATVVTELGDPDAAGTDAAQAFTRGLARQIDNGRLSDLTSCP